VSRAQSAPRGQGMRPSEESVDVFSELWPPLTREDAVDEAIRCLDCGTAEEPAPCEAACPAAIDVPGFIRAVAAGNPHRAAALIFDANPLGGSCARVCPTEELCEGACVLAREGRRPIAIGRLQRYATDVALSEPPEPSGSVPAGPPVVVVGAGPAGLACAATLADAGYRVTVYDERPEPGGLARYAVAPYRLNREPLPAEVARIAAKGVVFHFNTPIRDTDAWAAATTGAAAVFLGVGLGPDVTGDYPGADLPGVWRSLPFIEALKVGPRPRVGRRVAVIGGGNTAIDVAREAVRLGAEEVTILYRRTEAEMPAYRAEVQAARREGVRFQWLTVPVRFVGRGRLEAVQCRYVRLGEPDASGRRHPEPVPGTEFDIAVDTAVLAIGQEPRHDWADRLAGLRFDGGRIWVDPKTGETSVPGIFAGGDAVNGGATVVQAVAEGKRAAQGIRRRLEGMLGAPEPDRTASRAGGAPEVDGPLVAYRQGDALTLTVRRAWCKGCNICVEHCPASILALDDEELVYVTDIDRCVACGVCAERCPDFVFTLSVPTPVAVNG
jgi:dihydropyrimidine dehydrogenase (NAD+) subunit PreT